MSLLLLIRLSVFALGFCGIFAGLMQPLPFTGFLFAVVCFWLANLLYSLENMRGRVLFFWFQVTLFTFLISRPLIGFFRGEDWWDYGEENVTFALVSLMVTLVCLFFGALLGEYQVRKSRSLERPDHAGGKHTEESYFASSFRYYLGWCSLLIFYLSLAFTLLLGREKLAYIRTHTYYEYYVGFKSQLPYVVYEISTLTKYSLCFFLATLPKKKLAFPALCLYVLSALPDLLVGERNPIVLNIIFALAYYGIRDCLRGDAEADRIPEKPWMGWLEKSALLIGIPVGMILLSMMNYIRDGVKNTMSSLGLIADLFYKQGVSFKWLSLAYGVLPELPRQKGCLYSLGIFLDYLQHGSLAQKLFGAESLGSGNNMVRALSGNNLSHQISYLLMGEEQYLGGHGTGSSYLLEVYADFGWAGIGVFSLVLGFLLICGVRLVKKNVFVGSVTLLALTGLFLIPRAEATGFLTFFLTLQFWAAFVICFGAALLLCRFFYRRDPGGTGNGVRFQNQFCEGEK